MKYNYEGIAWSLDWEGCIAVKRQKDKNDIFHYSVSIRITNTNKELLENFKNTVKFGNIIGPFKNKKECYHKDSYEWKMSKEEIKKHLPLILPYLFAKQEQAELVIITMNIIKDIENVCKLSHQDRKEIYTYDEFCTLDWCYRRCKELNKKGMVND